MQLPIKRTNIGHICTNHTWQVYDLPIKCLFCKRSWHNTFTNFFRIARGCRQKSNISRFLLNILVMTNYRTISRIFGDVGRARRLPANAVRLTACQMISVKCIGECNFRVRPAFTRLRCQLAVRTFLLHWTIWGKFDFWNFLKWSDEVRWLHEVSQSDALAIRGLMQTFEKVLLNVLLLKFFRYSSPQVLKNFRNDGFVR